MNLIIIGVTKTHIHTYTTQINNDFLIVKNTKKAQSRDLKYNKYIISICAFIVFLAPHALCLNYIVLIFDISINITRI